MIRIRTKINGWTILTIYFNGEWLTFKRKEGVNSSSLVSKSLLFAGHNHLHFSLQASK